MLHETVNLALSLLVFASGIACIRADMKGRRSAVFLPQVAPEQGWTREQTLQHLCRKAGLPSDAWQAPTMKFFVFTAQVFGESLLTPDESR